MPNSSRTNFVNSWLTEMPQRIGSGANYYEPICSLIGEYIDSGAYPVGNLPNGYKKLIGQTIAFYWHEDANQQITIAAELAVAPQSLTVAMVGKHPSYTGKPPFASALYDTIVRDNAKSLRLYSDILLSDEGYGIWKTLFKMGHKISVYSDVPGQSFTVFNSQEEMDKYFTNDDSGKKYQFVVTEGTHIIDTIGVFRTRKLRELAGIL